MVDVGFEPTTQKTHGLSTTPFVEGISVVLVRLTTCERLTNSSPKLSLITLARCNFQTLVLSCHPRARSPQDQTDSQRPGTVQISSTRFIMPPQSSEPKHQTDSQRPGARCRFQALVLSRHPQSSELKTRYAHKDRTECGFQALVLSCHPRAQSSKTRQTHKNRTWCRLQALGLSCPPQPRAQSSQYQ